MTSATDPRDHGPRLLALTVADDPDSWTAAGFHVDGDRVQIGEVTFELTGTVEGARGITGWRLSGVAAPDGDLDGLPTEVVGLPDRAEPVAAQPAHPNGVVGLDHVVVATPDLHRTIDALAAAGLDLRRIRDTDETGSSLRQAFFRLGPTVLEVVSGDLAGVTTSNEAPAGWFGIAADVDDLDVTAAFLGDGLGRIKPAVQPGRRIATLRHRTFHMTLAVAVMDHRHR